MSTTSCNSPTECECTYWEYWAEEFEENVYIEPRLNELGKLRWELVSMNIFGAEPFSLVWYCLFKRPRTAPRPEHIPLY